MAIFDWLMGTIARKQVFPLLKVHFGTVMSRRPPREPKMKVILYGDQAILDSLLRVSQSFTNKRRESNKKLRANIMFA